MVDPLSNGSSIWRVSVRTRGLKREPVPASWEHLGGRGLIARILVDEVPPECFPLGPLNKLIFCPGLLTGHMLSSIDRLSVGGKSPLTGGVKESNSGGTTSLQIAAMGIKALIIEDWPATPGWSVLYLGMQGMRFDPAYDLAGLGVYDSAEALKKRYGKKVAIAIIGPAGERQLLSAGILNLDKDGFPSRINARGGLGAADGFERPESHRLRRCRRLQAPPGGRRSLPGHPEGLQQVPDGPPADPHLFRLRHPRHGPHDRRVWRAAHPQLLVGHLRVRR